MTTQITKPIKLGTYFEMPRLDTVIRQLLKIVPEDAEEIVIHIKVPFSFNCLNTTIDHNLDEIPVVFETISEQDKNLSGTVYISYEGGDTEHLVDDLDDFINA